MDDNPETGNPGGEGGGGEGGGGEGGGGEGGKGKQDCIQVDYNQSDNPQSCIPILYTLILILFVVDDFKESSKCTENSQMQVTKENTVHWEANLHIKGTSTIMTILLSVDKTHHDNNNSKLYKNSNYMKII